MSLVPMNFAERLVPRLPAAQASQAVTPCAEPAAPAVSSSVVGAAFCHFTESSCALRAPEDRSGLQVATRSETASAEGATFAGAVALSSASAFILRLIAAHDGRAEADVLARLIAAEGEAIGLSPLLAAASENLSQDLADLPDFSRRAQNRFRRPHEADGRGSRSGRLGR